MWLCDTEYRSRGHRKCHQSPAVNKNFPDVTGRERIPLCDTEYLSRDQRKLFSVFYPWSFTRICNRSRSWETFVVKSSHFVTTESAKRSPEQKLSKSSTQKQSCELPCMKSASSYPLRFFPGTFVHLRINNAVSDERRTGFVLSRVMTECLDSDRLHGWTTYC